MNEEIWKDIPGYEGEYQVSNIGRVRGVDRTIVEITGMARAFRGRVLKLGLNCGYWVVGLKHGGKRKLCKVHRLVMLAFVGPCPPGMQVNHRNGIRTDACLENLEYVTPSENVRYSFDILHIKRIASRRGEAVNTAKLTREQVAEIRLLLNSGLSPERICVNYGVYPSTIRRIATGKNWGWYD